MATAVDTQKIDINDLEEIVFSSITALGHEDSDARLIAEVILKSLYAIMRLRHSMTFVCLVSI